jgi:acetyl-CoA carboxylase biotin carboxyl carrier protein
MDAEQYLRSGLRGLLDVLQSSDVREVEIQEGELTVRLSRAVAGRESEGVAGDTAQKSVELLATEERFVVSPMVGTFYRAGEPGAPVLATEGSFVEDDTVVGIIEALGALTEVQAGLPGTITAVLATDGHAVEYGQTLFEVSSDG